LRRDAHEGRQGRRDRARLRQAQDRHRPRRQAVSGPQEEEMSWVNAFAGFLVAHMVGDYLFQTDWQARHKRGGLTGDKVAFRALLAHVTTYTIAFIPALIWIGSETSWGVAVLAAVLIFVPHL